MFWSDPYSYDADPDLYLNWAVLRKDEFSFVLFFNYFFIAPQEEAGELSSSDEKR